MDAKYTPGPWEVRVECGICCIRPATNDQVGFSFGYAPIAKVKGDSRIGCQPQNARRIVACVNACEGIATEELEDIANTGGMLGPREEISRIAKQRDGLANALSELLNEIDGLMGESAGVYGLHLNGDPSSWSEIEEGGRFERLSSMSKARAVLAKATGEQS